MGAGRHERQLVRIRRRGRHTTPSQVEKVAEKAGKAAPAMAIAGALVAAPQAQHAFAEPATVAAAHVNQPASAHAQSTRAILDSVASRAASGADAIATTLRTASATVAAEAAKTPANSYYTVKSGDTLSGIADQYYRNADDWPWLYHVNDTKISDPNLIYPGQVLKVPADPPSAAVVNSYIPKHAAPAVTTASTSPSSPAASGSGDSSSGGSGSQPTVTESASQGGGGSASTSTSSGSGSGEGGGGSTTLSGTLDCSGLEQLWEEAGGNPADAFMAAEIAMAESSGNQYALSPSDDYGYWQINISHGSLATFNALGNARSAVIISQDGTDWDPWTTYLTGAYVGQC